MVDDADPSDTSKEIAFPSFENMAEIDLNSVNPVQLSEGGTKLNLGNLNCWKWCKETK